MFSSFLWLIANIVDKGMFKNLFCLLMLQLFRERPEDGKVG
jgi:hypothetical protein